MKTIVGLFDNFAQAEAAVRDLEQAGYDKGDVSVVANESTRTGVATTTDNDTSAAEGAGTGAVIGGVTGGAAGLIASLTALAIPGIGP
ncbi:MAG TPA: general stress protein, partial [Tepidisphaeraceae bacterium]|nr:general stress protein [Tepidisphaeraceae bacterium]